MKASEDIFAAIARAASESGLLIFVIGGHAVNAYQYARTTLDADFLICVDDLTAWRTTLEKMGYVWLGQTEGFMKMAPPKKDDPKALFLDIMLAERTTLSKIAAESRRLPFGSAELRVPQPLHLMALKLHAMNNPKRRELGKDLFDILHLIRVCELDPKSPQFEAILQRYANEETRAVLDDHLKKIR